MNHPDLATSYNDISSIYVAVGNNEQMAEDYRKKAVQVQLLLAKLEALLGGLDGKIQCTSYSVLLWTRDDPCYRVGRPHDWKKQC